MNYSIEVTEYFARQLKRLIKKFPSLKQEYAEFLTSLRENPQQGARISNNCYKIRLAIGSKGRGKSGGARVITYVKITTAKIYLLSIYDKSEQSDVTDNDLKIWIKNL